MKEYVNYHCHSDKSNFAITDSPVRPIDYINRIKELGHKSYVSTEHGLSYGWVEKYLLCEKHNIKFVYGVEGYIEYENKTYHIMFVAKSFDGMKSINRALNDAVKNNYKNNRPKLTIDMIKEHIITNEVICTSACFLKGTMVETLEGFKEIEMVSDKDYVLSHNNIYEKVNYPTSRKFNGKMVKLTFNRSNREINCTDSHKFLIYNDNINQPIWKEAKYLSKNDILLTSIPIVNYTYKNIIEFDKLKNISNRCNNLKKCNHKIILNEKDMMTFGLWLGDGYMSNRGQGQYYVGFSFNINEFDNYYNNFVKQTMSKFGIDPKIIYMKDKNKVDLVYNSKELFNIFNQLFENKKSKDKFIPNRLKHISENFDKALVFGYLLADGHFRYNSSIGGRIASVTISQNLHCDILNMYKTFGCIPTERITKEYIDKKHTKHQQSYSLVVNSAILGKIDKIKNIDDQYIIFKESIGNVYSKNDIVIYDNKKYFKRKIKTLSSYDYKGDVYCLNVGNSHSFNCEGIIVHNCVFGVLKDETLFLFKELYNIFKDNFYLEVLAHNTPMQIEFNKKAKELSKKYGIKLMGATDSHVIYSEQEIERDDLILAKRGNIYDDGDESGWYLQITQTMIH